MQSILSNPLIVTLLIFVASLFLTIFIDFLVSIWEKHSKKKKYRKNIEALEKQWEENQVIRNRFLNEYHIPQSTFDLKDKEKDVLLIYLTNVISGLNVYRSPSTKYNNEPWIPYPNPAVIFINKYVICTHTFNHCLEIVDNLKKAGINVAADSFELEEKISKGKM